MPVPTLHNHAPDPPLPEIMRIEKLVLAGVMDTMKSLFDVPSSQMIFFATTNKMQVAQRIATMRNGPNAQIQWPLVFVHVTGFSSAMQDDLHAVNSKQLARMGINVHVADTQNFTINVKIVPVVFELEVFYFDDDWERSLRFACEWTASAQMNRMNFSFTYHDFDADIRVKMSDSFSTPDREEAVNQSNQFEYSGTMQVGGYVQASGSDAISKVAIIRQLDIRTPPGQPTGGIPPTGYPIKQKRIIPMGGE